MHWVLKVFGQLVLSLRDVELREAFGCDKNDKIVALLQIGTAAEKLERDCKPKDLSRFVSHL